MTPHHLVSTARQLLVSIALACCLNTPFVQAGFILIDDFSAPQSVSVFGSGSQSGTVNSSSVMGGYRTFELVSTSVEPDARARLGNAVSSPYLSLSSDALVNVTSFSVRWAGASGTGFSTPVNLLTLPQGMNSEIEFTVLTSDHSGQLTWSFIDVNNQVSIYDVNVSANLTPVLYELRLNDFSNPSGFDWTQIKSIELSGGNVPEWDFTLTGGVIVGVPEPSFLPLVLLSFGAAMTTHRTRKIR